MPVPVNPVIGSQAVPGAIDDALASMKFARGSYRDIKRRQGRNEGMPFYDRDKKTVLIAIDSDKIGPASRIDEYDPSQEYPDGYIVAITAPPPWPTGVLTQGIYRLSNAPQTAWRKINVYTAAEWSLGITETMHQDDALWMANRSDYESLKGGLSPYYIHVKGASRIGPSPYQFPEGIYYIPFLQQNYALSFKGPDEFAQMIASAQVVYCSQPADPHPPAGTAIDYQPAQWAANHVYRQGELVWGPKEGDSVVNPAIDATTYDRIWLQTDSINVTQPIFHQAYEGKTLPDFTLLASIGGGSGGGLVASVNGQIGVVVLTAADVGAADTADLDNTNQTIAVMQTSLDAVRADLIAARATIADLVNEFTKLKQGTNP